MPTYKREERLKSRKLIRELFLKGRSFTVFPFRVLTMENDQQVNSPVEFAIAVPKRNLKKATERNSVKRVVREAWRLNKEAVYLPLSGADKRIVVMLIYNNRQILTFKEAEQKIKEIVSRLTDIYAKQD